MYDPIAAQSSLRDALDDRNVFGLGFACLAVLAYFVANLLAIFQRLAEADRRDMHEDILTAVIWGDEAEALVLSKEFYGTGRHVCLFGG